MIISSDLWLDQILVTRHFFTDLPSASDDAIWTVSTAKRTINGVHILWVCSITDIPKSDKTVNKDITGTLPQLC